MSTPGFSALGRHSYHRFPSSDGMLASQDMQASLGAQPDLDQLLQHGLDGSHEWSSMTTGDRSRQLEQMQLWNKIFPGEAMPQSQAGQLRMLAKMLEKLAEKLGFGNQLGSGRRPSARRWAPSRRRRFGGAPSWRGNRAPARNEGGASAGKSAGQPASSASEPAKAAPEGGAGASDKSGAGKTAAPSTGTPKTDGKTDATTDAGKGAVAGGAKTEGLPYEPNAKAVEAGRSSGPGKVIAQRTKQNAEIYRQASAKTGVPASMIAAIHLNEGQMGRGVGPESGFGLDPRHIKTGSGNRILAKHGMGAWERGTGSENSRLQSAVIAAETLKASGKAAGAKVGPNMSAKDMSVAIHSYGTGSASRFTKQAQQTGRSFMFDTSDDNPHPKHPGGTSIGKDGQVVPVKGGYKKGLLRWDVALPLINEQLGGPTTGAKAAPKADAPKTDAPKENAPPTKPAGAGAPRLSGLPKRADDAPTGSEFMASIKGMKPGPERERLILEQIEKGNVPESSRQLQPVTVSRKGKDGKMHEMTMYAMPDYIAIGSDKDNVRIPMTGATAQKIANKVGGTLPTAQMVDDIHSNAQDKLHLAPFQWKPGRTHANNMMSPEYAAIHDKRIDDQMAGRDGDGIISGHKKDIVIPARKGKVAIYGARYQSGARVQPYSNKHYDGYSDYSHGARIVGRNVLVDGKMMDINDVMADPNLAPLVSRRGPIKSPAYPVD